MKFDHAVKYKGVYYPTGAEVPVEEKPKDTEEVKADEVKEEDTKESTAEEVKEEVKEAKAETKKPKKK